MSVQTPPLTDRRHRFREAEPSEEDAALASLRPSPAVTPLTSAPAVKKPPKKARKKRQPAPEIRPVDVLGISPKIDTDLVLVELGAVAFSNICDLFGPDNRFLPPSEIPHAAGRTIASFKVLRSTRRRIGKGKDAIEETVEIIGVTLAPKLLATELLMKRLGMFTARLPPEKSIVLDLPERMVDIR